MRRLLIVLVASGWGACGVAGAGGGAPDGGRRAGADAGPSFRRHVVPLLGRLGCNGRACHGSFQGQGGFRLSLFGYDFRADYQAIADPAAGRVDRDDAPASLILQKPTLAVAHRGGKRLVRDGWQYRLLLDWIRRGARSDAAADWRLLRLTVEPAEHVFRRAGEQFRLRVVAHWSDGTAEDVTDLARFRSNDDAVATVSEAGLVTAAGKGDTHVVAFYDDGIAPVPVILPVSDRVGDRYPAVPTPTRVDELVVAKLRRCGIVPSEPCTDAEFLRRAGIDLTGTLPTPAEVEAFLADPAADKRARKVDELLARPAYAAWWATRLCDLTGNNGRHREGPLALEISRRWYDWVYRRVRDNVGYDRIAAGVLRGRGRRPGQTFEEYCAEMSAYFRADHPADFAERETMPFFWSRLTVQKPEEKALAVAHAFMGVRLECAQCHKHPFDQWSKDDFDRFTAFFDHVQYGTPEADNRRYARMLSEVGPTKGPKKAPELARLVREGEVIPWREVYLGEVRPPPAPKGKQPRSFTLYSIPMRPTRRVVTAQPLGGSAAEIRAGPDPRDTLAEWLLRPDNAYLARAFVNRAWAHYFGTGVVDPPDDLNLANPPANAALLDYLARGFVAHGYDMKWLHRTIATSRTYQLAWRPNATNLHDLRNFSRAVPRRLPAEVAYDAVTQATAAAASVPAWQADVRRRATGDGVVFASARPGTTPAGYFLSVFGRPERVGTCDCERSADASLLQTLLLLNDGEILGKIDRGRGWVAEVGRRFGTEAGVAPATSAQLRGLVREAYLRTVSRPPSEQEETRALAYFGEAPNPAAGLRDLLWALLNTKEFIVNH